MPTPGRARQARRWVYGFAALLAIALIALKVVDWSRSPQVEPSPQPGPIPLVPISSSPFLNTRPDVAYVGTDVCRTCHSSHEVSFRRTGMGQSMAELDPSREPPDGEFDHPASKRRYQIRRSGKQLWHRELLLTHGTEEVLLAEYPLKYVIGSGRHSRTYALEIDGFLTESPATWYSSRKAWGMSPGYDGADQPGFARPVGENCLYCHAGRVEALGGTLHKMRVLEAQISCERCHGPGALHVARHRPSPPAPLPQQERGAQPAPSPPAPLPQQERGERSPAADGIDHTIVNPVHLPRHLAEAVCQQCHLQSDAACLARGRKRTDFRPGLPLQDFKHDYRLETPNPAMTVVGHVEQLHMSRCYQAAPTLTCLTCHDPHGPARKAGSSSLEYTACAKCHAPERCKVDKAVRDRDCPDNNCVHCHMPRSPTDIPHLAFTHHRIGIHRSEKGSDAKSAEKTQEKPGGLTPFRIGALERSTLVPVLDLKRFGKHELTRSLGLACLDFAEKQKTPHLATPFLQRAVESLTAASDAGLRDSSQDASLDLAHFLLNRARPERTSMAVDAGMAVNERCSSLFAQAYADIQRGSPQTALPHVKELTRLRRNATDWLLLAGCEQAAGNLAGAIAALEQAVRINPRLWQAHQQLAEHYRQQGNRVRATWHERRAVP